MIIERTNDLALVKSILTNPKVWDAIKGSNQVEPENFEVPEWPIYLVGRESGDSIGLFVIHENGAGEWKCHVQVLPEKRKEYAVEFGNRVIAWVWKNTDIGKLTANIPRAYPNVAEFAKLQGFTVVGENEKDLLLEIERAE